ncbi:MAG: VOC family protein [Actinomycetota bacterium]
MTDIDRHSPGMPAWIDLGTSDPEAAGIFYARLFGWQVQDLGPDAGDYRMCSLRERPVAGIGSQADDTMPPYWTTYFCVESVESTVAKITANGGTMIVPPMDVMDAGRMAVASDPTGAVFSLWQPLGHQGIGVSGELGTRCWSELATRDTATAASFYAAVFGWTAQDAGNDMHYTLFQLGSMDAGGMMAMGDMFPPEVPPYWAVYFYTDDIDGTVAPATGLGGNIIVPPSEIPGVGRFSVVVDPQGATFSLLQPNPAA